MILYLEIIGKKENITISVKCFIMSSLFHITLPNFPLEKGNKTSPYIFAVYMYTWEQQGIMKRTEPD